MTVAKMFAIKAIDSIPNTQLINNNNNNNNLD
jgi:hypothetical protein